MNEHGSRTWTEKERPSPTASRPPQDAKKRLRIALLLSSLWSILLAVFAYEGFFSDWEDTIARKQDLFPSESKSSQFALIVIDHIPADRPWPWPRLEYALCLRGLLAQLPQSVVFEVLLSEKGTKMSSFDQTFASLIRRINRVCFAADALLAEQQGEPLPAGATRLRGLPNIDYLTEYRSVIWPGATFVGDCPVGLANLEIPSGEVRSLPLVFRIQDALVPSLSLQAAAVFLGADLRQTTVRLGHAVILRDQQGKRIRTIPIDADGRTAVRYRHSPATIPRVDYDSYLVYANQAAHGEPTSDELPSFRGRQVWIGVTDGDIAPKLSTPVGKMTPVELHMQVARQIVEGEFIRPLPWYLSAALAFILCLWGTRLFVRLPPLWAVTIMGAVFAGAAGVSIASFLFLGLAFPLVTLFFSLLGAIICGTSVRLWNFPFSARKPPVGRSPIVVEVAPPVSPSGRSSEPIEAKPAYYPPGPAGQPPPLSPSLIRLQGALQRLEERRRRERSSGNNGLPGHP
ncbi:Stand-alone CHASE2 sensor domain [Methylacidimicrobium sp. AP8]|uniref:CHASE2 domain-containing protein n=1 Tax=Methylacidimicrobium sp. AP8 TaxID=2730359 RepID=UPI0018C020EC|nr:CHASE2 domain-containing protein [Methylacidimicrobium sp. AP8]CAB4244644.1 Stand-alone CHASE2 sensor domain [Methylacidimicrobium sp. AP8]